MDVITVKIETNREFMNLIKLNVWAVLLCLSAANSIMAQEIKVSAGIFIGIINENGKGPYQLILKEAARRADVDISEHVFPLKRAVMMFINKKALAIYGMTEAVLMEIEEKKIITSYPLGVYKLFIFTRKGETPISSYEQLKGKSVGGVIGYEAYYQELTNNDISIDYLADEKNQIKKLEQRRFDAILGFMPDWIPFLNKLSYDPDFPVHIGYDYMTVWNIPEGKAFVDDISPKLREMHSDGTLKRILGDRYMEFEYKASKTYEWQPKCAF